MILFGLLCLAGAPHASAAAENVVTSAPKARSGEWITNSNGIRYRYTKDGKYAKDTWLNIKGGIYHFDKDGYCETGWITWNRNRYCASSAGKLYVKKWIQKNGKDYFLRSNGVLARDRLVKSGGKYYYVNESGVRVKNSWVTIGDDRCYFNNEGVRLQNTWLKYKNKYYYLDASGNKAVSCWVGKYYVGKNGARKTDCVVDGYYLDSTGKRTKVKWDYIFVGDSRIVGMQMARASADTVYIAKVSMGYAWLQSTAGPKLKEYLKKKPDVTVILALGINDLDSIDRYITYYRNLIAAYPKTTFRVLSVNPVNDKIAAAHGYKVRNTQIAAFNAKMKEEIGRSTYLTTYTYLRKKGFETRDGVHYSLKDYGEIYDYIIGKLQ